MGMLVFQPFRQGGCAFARAVFLNTSACGFAFISSYHCARLEVLIAGRFAKSFPAGGVANTWLRPAAFCKFSDDVVNGFHGAGCAAASMRASGRGEAVVRL